ncbi:solute carrier family 22 member 16 isoform X1 [Vulpes lagopus]|uniref:solute carrier family 22 member 16 isoform X1 n=1 Tax=Vulpes lagopus TaxID=494514 RepID=UPI001BC9B398|nr:solute carrier family 22 member 16 isoform X1 [Vulpes lagopus]
MTVSPYHTCRPPGNVSRVLFHNISSWRLEDIWILFFTGHEDRIIVQLQNGEVWELTSCHRFRRDEKSGLNSDYNGPKSSFPCVDGYVYDKSKWDSTVVTQWDLVCNREWFAKVIQPVFMLGVLLGAMIFGYLSDRKGRRLVLWSTSAGIFFFGIAAAFSFDYYSFMIARFLLAMSGSGYLVVVFVYVTEFIGMKARTWACIQMHSFFAIGTMVVALTGYFVRTWWIYQIVLSTVTIPFVLCCWILPETPFWLLSEGRYEEAQKVVDTIAKWNRASSCKLSELLSLDLNDPVGNEPLEVKKHNLLDLFCDWNVGTRTLTVWLIWFTGCLGFYFFSLNSVNLGGNEYLNLFLMGAVEIPAYIFMCLGIDRIGRRSILAFALISGALFCGVVMVIPKDYFIWTVVVTMAGKFAIGASFGLIYLYTAELYPTRVAGRGERQHGEPHGEHRGPVLRVPLQRLDLPATGACEVPAPDAAGRQCSQLPSLPGPVRSQFRVQWWRFTETLLTAPRWGRRAGLLFYVGRSPSAPGEPFIAVVAAVEGPSPAPPSLWKLPRESPALSPASQASAPLTWAPHLASTLGSHGLPAWRVLWCLP